MTDKQIIIDGVDVSGCGFYHSETGTECHIALAFAEEYTDDNHTYLKCEQNPNCDYKQLKRKEQECEELKEDYTLMKQLRDLALKNYDEEFEYKRQITVEHLEQKKELLKQLDQLKKENEELKQKNKDLRHLLQNEFDWHITNDKINKVNSEYAYKLKQTLEEIRGLILKTPTSSQQHCVNTKSVILQKINEVIDE